MPTIRKLKVDSDLVQDTFRQSGRMEPSCDLSYSSDYRRDLIEALESEHVNECDTSACDINAAFRAGCYESAAFLLSGATETPYLILLDHVHRHNGTLPTRTLAKSGHGPADWDDWYAFHLEHGRRCRACGSFTYVDELYRPRETTCGNCLETIPARPDCFRAQTRAERTVSSVARKGAQ